ncbi:MAG: AmpG family muropeptide MFS transporter [Alphaproteobacteria bacterium]|jgi:PAT family beta-lactamase induction signal transducer AmpG|nr:AmpG family muropeptide MFS transporter [Alphaproteobacteria bacterium]
MADGRSAARRPRDGLGQITPKSGRGGLVSYLDRRIAAIFFLGISSGLPLALVGGTLTVWMAREGVDKTTVGLFSAVSLPYVLKFLWAPVIDRIRFPLLTRLLGQRRGWTVATQLALMAGIAAMALSDPAANPWLMALFALIVSFCSASQDVVIDAYRVELLEEGKIGAGVSSVVFGYRIGMLMSGAGALHLAGFLDWSFVYLIMAALVPIGLVTILLSREPVHGVDSETAARERRVADYLARRPELSRRRAAVLAWFYDAVASPFVDFMTRPQWLAILLFIVFYKLGDSMAGVMTSYFLVELGFSNAEIANAGKIVGFGASILGFIIGGWLIDRLGILWALWICGGVQMLSNLMLAVQALVGHDIGMLAVAVGVENLAGGMGTAALVAYLTSLCNLSYTATQYALLSAVASVGRTLLAAPAGRLAEMIDWLPFFLVTTLAALPGLALLLWLTVAHRRRAAQPEEDTAEPPPSPGL